MPVHTSGQVEQWEFITEDLSFVFFSCDLKGFVHYANRSWFELADTQGFPDYLLHSGPGENVFDAFEQANESQFLSALAQIRAGSVSHFETFVPSHLPNQNRWMLVRLQRLGDEIIVSGYFLKYYEIEPPTNLKIRCIGDGGSWEKQWAFDDSPVDDETSLALCPNCSLLVYTFLRQG